MSFPNKLRFDCWQYVDDACNDTLDDEGYCLLADRLSADRQLLSVYVEYMQLHAELQFSARANRTTQAVTDLLLDDFDADAAPANQGNVVLAESNRVARGDDLFGIELSAPFPGSEQERFSNGLNAEGNSLKNAGNWLVEAFSGRSAYSLSLAAAAFVLLAGLAIMAIIRADHDNPDRAPSAQPARPFAARIVSAAECRWEPAAKRWAIGEALGAGEQLQLQSGYVELEFESGSKVLLQGPARFMVESAGASRLSLGSLTARVPERGRGFTVHTPSAKVVDLGTEFGVRVDDAGETEVHVFSGKVLAEYCNELAVASEEESAFEIGANEAILLGSDRSAVRLPAKPGEFVQRIPPRMQIPVYGTGRNASVGQADPHWRITAISNDPGFKPMQAIVCESHVGYVRSDSSRWVSLTAANAHAPFDCRYTFETTFDLSEFDAATARISGRFSADNVVISLRLNGNELPVPAPSGDWGFSEMTRFSIDRHFVKGVNTLEIVVDNRSNVESGPPDNPMALQVELHGTARHFQ